MKLLPPLLMVLSLLAGCASSSPTPAPSPATAPTTTPASPLAATRAPAPAPTSLVVWISVDGFRGDYLPRARAPFLKSLVRSGAWTAQMSPPYPSLTFASHTSEVTGASPARHGIAGNSFYDRSLRQEFNFPPRPDLLKAEPIWTSATRQGLRVAVFDWPFSQSQTGNYASAYCNDVYDGKQTDEDRMSKVTAVLRYDAGPRGRGSSAEPVSLVMGYVESLDKAGHQMGPASNAPIEQIERIDALLAQVHAQAVETLRQQFPPGSHLYFVVSTDHGMTDVKYALNLKLLLEGLVPAEGHIITGGGTGHVFLPDSPDKPAKLQAIRDRLAPYPFAHIYTPDTLPKHWSILDADRTGDLYIDLDQGYTFNSRGREPLLELATEPTTRISDRAPRGMHSYDPANSPDMLGLLAISKYPDDFGGKNLGPVDARQLAPTISRFLHIAPPSSNEVTPLPLK